MIDESLNLRSAAGDVIEDVQFHQGKENAELVLQLLSKHRLREISLGLCSDFNVLASPTRRQFAKEFWPKGREVMVNCGLSRAHSGSQLVQAKLLLGRTMSDSRLYRLVAKFKGGLLQRFEVNPYGGTSIGMVFQASMSSGQVANAMKLAGWKDKGVRGDLPRYFADSSNWGIRAFVDQDGGRGRKMNCSVEIIIDFSERFKRR